MADDLLAVRNGLSSRCTFKFGELGLEGHCSPTNTELHTACDNSYKCFQKGLKLQNVPGKVHVVGYCLGGPNAGREDLRSVKFSGGWLRRCVCGP